MSDEGRADVEGQPATEKDQRGEAQPADAGAADEARGEAGGLGHPGEETGESPTGATAEGGGA